MITLAVGSDKQFANLVTVLGAPEIATNSKFTTNPARVQNREECKEIIRRLICTFDRAPLLQELSKHAVPAGGVNNMAEVFDLPQADQLVVRNLDDGTPIGIKQVAFESGLDVFCKAVGEKQEGCDADNGIVLLPPPEYGQHTMEVLSQYCNSTELDYLIAEKVIAQR